MQLCIVVVRRTLIVVKFPDISTQQSSPFSLQYTKKSSYFLLYSLGVTYRSRNGLTLTATLIFPWPAIVLTYPGHQCSHGNGRSVCIGTTILTYQYILSLTLEPVQYLYFKTKRNKRKLVICIKLTGMQNHENLAVKFQSLSMSESQNWSPKSKAKTK